ncbi:DUF1259 domain-containing protein [Clostridium sp. P21]|uniref:DUF1259 domain-containing protein n=1 Tax=Clostridium muellerianum TaxID=2716538 RepID=A0A7Y0EEF4_9CLOT|nr:DUF1259 domain-containing protein [Clostridium muellerianum]NMM61853.1 DUF1259 domain-containing protein [Clostridium muellerianum]
MSNHSHCKSNSLCKEFAKILGAEIITSNKRVCAVGFNRNIRARILGRRTRSPLALSALFSFDIRSMDEAGNALNLGETVILEEEVNDFITALRREGLLVTALHNHWLFDRPRLMYIHFESIDKPLDFARKVARALRVLRTTQNQC